MTEKLLNEIIEYSKLPLTKEKEEIDKKYMTDEIGRIDFCIMAKDYLERAKKGVR